MRNVEGRPEIDAQIGNKNNCWPPRSISSQIVSTQIYDCHENFKKIWYRERGGREDMDMLCFLGLRSESTG